MLTRPNTFRIVLHVVTCLFSCGGTYGEPTSAAWLFTSFRGNGDGLHLAYSDDARDWTEIPGVVLKPTVGGKLMRDPHIVRGPDGVFHMVWTSGWHDKGIGYASSKDLVTWSPQRYLPLMEETPSTNTCWAPEAYYDPDAEQYLVVWSSDVPANAPNSDPQGGYHRAYYVVTKDFQSFSKPKMLFDPGFNNIDTTMVKVGDTYRIVFKETDDQPAGKWGRVCAAEADNPLGPYRLLPEPLISGERVEGPALVQVDGKTLLYVYYYANHRYGAQQTADWTNWQDATASCSIVDGQRHGSILSVSAEELKTLAPNALRNAPQAVLPGVNADPHIAFFGDRAYLYPTTDGSEGWRSTSFHAWSSDNLVDWRDEGVILDLPRDLEWADLHAWAPAIATKNGQYFYYYSANKNIGVAVSDSPAGPFRDPLGKPLVAAADYRGMQCIDPMVFVDRNGDGGEGEAYLYWGQGRCKVVKLGDDMISFDPAAVRDITPPGYNEGPFLHKRNGTYYLSWSEYDTRDPRYSVAYGVAESPLGPFTKAKKNPILRQSGVVKGAGHHSIGRIPGRDQWVIAYHRFRIPGGDGYHRETCLSPLEHNDDGTIQPVDVFKEVHDMELSLPARDAASEPVPSSASQLNIDLGQSGKPISRDLFGIFFEDLNYAADGGLYAELVQNRSFEYSSADKRGWHALTNWGLVERQGGKGSVIVDSGQPLHHNNPHYAVLGVVNEEGEVGLKNDGFQGIPIEAGKKYDVSLFARQVAGSGGRLLIRLESADGKTLAEVDLGVPTSGWKKITAVLAPAESNDEARLVVIGGGVGRVALDMISLFPQETFRGRKNGLRRDLAQSLADLKPKFMRFPGGCLVHGDGLDNMYRWKETIGPVEERKSQRNIWRYHQSMGLGYFEYFQFCEDIGAEPLPVVPAGVCCQNAGASVTGKWGEGQRGLPLEEMPAYIQEVLDLIEYANGPSDSEWGRRRAAAGHPQPFQLKYLGIGNEDHITPAFEQRFRMIHNAIATAHPEITLIGTVGPAPDGPDYDNGWRIAGAMQLSMVDEHYYKPPDWFHDNLTRYDTYDRNRSAVYLGEFAAHDKHRQTTLRSALAEAAYMTHLERNGDIVHMASYAPLLGKVGRTQWNPNLIYFSNTQVCPTINYYVQQMFATGSGEEYLEAVLEAMPGAKKSRSDLIYSVVRNVDTSEIILKLVNLGGDNRVLRCQLTGGSSMDPTASCVVLSGDPTEINRLGASRQLQPVKKQIEVSESFEYMAPAHSLSVIRVRQH